MFKRLVIAVVMLMFAVPAMALDFDACSEHYNPDICVGKVTVADMGTFDADGNFTWNMALKAELQNWVGPEWNAMIDFDAEFTPVIKDGLDAGWNRMDYRQYAGEPTNIRFVVQFKKGKTLTYPRSIWVESCPDGNCGSTLLGGDNTVYMIDVEPPAGTDWDNFLGAVQCAETYTQYAEPNCVPEGDWNPCWNPFDQAMNDDPDVNPSCKAWVIPQKETIDYGTPTFIYAADIESITWVNEGITTTGPFHNYYVDYKFLRYEMGINQIVDTGWDENTFGGWPEIYGPRFASGIVPTIGINTALVKFKDDTTVELKFDVTNNQEMPTVSRTTEVPWINGAGKTHKKTVEVENLTARELNGGLLIQWAEPDGAMSTPHMKLRLYIGNKWGMTQSTFEEDTFLFLDCPVQSGSVFLPEDEWSAFKTKMIGLGESEVYVSGMYRLQPQFTMENGWVTNYQNRGFFEYITFPVQ